MTELALATDGTEARMVVGIVVEWQKALATDERDVVVSAGKIRASGAGNIIGEDQNHIYQSIHHFCGVNFVEQPSSSYQHIPGWRNWTFSYIA